MNESQRTHRPAGGTELSLWDVAKILLSKLHWVLLAGIVAAALVYMAISVFVTPTYESRVSFYVYNSTNNTAQGTINNSDLQAAESLATTYSKILESNSVLDSVLTDIRGETALSRKELNRMVKVSVISDTQLLEVVVTSTDPKLACRIAGAFAKGSRRQRSSASPRQAVWRSSTSRRSRRKRLRREPCLTVRSAL